MMAWARLDSSINERMGGKLALLLSSYLSRAARYVIPNPAPRQRRDSDEVHLFLDDVWRIFSRRRATAIEKPSRQAETSELWAVRLRSRRWGLRGVHNQEPWRRGVWYIQLCST